MQVGSGGLVPGNSTPAVPWLPASTHIPPPPIRHSILVYPELIVSPYTHHPRPLDPSDSLLTQSRVQSVADVDAVGGTDCLQHRCLHRDVARCVKDGMLDADDDALQRGGGRRALSQDST